MTVIDRRLKQHIGQYDARQKGIRQAILLLFDHMWKPKGLIRSDQHQDLCVVRDDGSLRRGSES